MGLGSTHDASHSPEPSFYGYPTQPHYIILPPAPHLHHRRRRLIRYGAAGLSVFLVLCAALYFLWPSEPKIEVARLRLNRIGVRTKESGSILPSVLLDISLGLTVKVHNRDYFGIDYDYVNVGIAYRGEKIGWVRSRGGYVPARRVAFVDATLELNGIELLDDVIYIVGDVARGQIPLQTVTDFDGRVRVLSVNVPLKVIMSCDIVVDIEKQAILSQDCDLRECC